jgi:hypothetical protein
MPQLLMYPLAPFEAMVETGTMAENPSTPAIAKAGINFLTNRPFSAT